MKNRKFSRMIMVVAGLMAVVAILLSPSLRIQTPKETAKTEQSPEKGNQAFVQVPSDAIPGSAVKMEEPSAPLLESLIPDKQDIDIPVVNTEKIVNYLQVLFSSIIASNAP